MTLMYMPKPVVAVSGEEIIKSNSWDEEGSHVITVRVKEIYGYEGESKTWILKEYGKKWRFK